MPNGQARNDIYTVLVIVTLLFMITGIALAALQLYDYSLPNTRTLQKPRPPRSPDVLKTTTEEGGASPAGPSSDTGGGKAGGAAESGAAGL